MVFCSWNIATKFTKSERYPWLLAMHHHNSPDEPHANDTVVRAVDARVVTTSPRDGGWTWRKKTAQ
nr:hypothetical protein [Tanacetum cinerariifolium]